ncbi:MAG: xanthine dehydrogenase family protein molybdopterin-binding subunit [Candidatus Dormibacteraceae bacterium]
MKVIGTARPRIEGRAKVTGQSRFTADLGIPGLLHTRLQLSPHPAARIVRVNLEAARALPGVVLAICGRDLPEVPAAGPEAPLARERVYFSGQPVVAVAAVSEAIATDAIALVEVEYELQPAAVSVAEALRAEAPQVLIGAGGAVDDSAAHGVAASGEELGEEHSVNVTAQSVLRQGDVSAALARSEVVVSGTFRSPQVHQGFMETHIAAARQEDDGTSTIWSSTQGVFTTRSGVSAALGIPLGDVRVLQAEVGGGFGGKALLLEPLLVLMAKMARRPVQLALTRAEEFMLGRGAPGFSIQLTLGSDAQGRLQALRARIEVDNGASPGGLAGLVALMLAGTYKVPNYEVITVEVATNKTPVAAYRAPGANQGCFAIESALDELARRLGQDPIEMRLLNAVAEGDLRPDGQRWPRIGLRECLEAARRHPLYTDPHPDDVGVGVAAGCWLGGLEPAAAACRVEPDGSLVIQVGHSDISGTSTTLSMIAAELLGVPMDKIRIRTGDTETSPHGGMAGGSKTIYTVGLAVHEAVLEARRQLLEIAADELEASIEDLDLSQGEVFVRGVPGRSLPIGTLAGLAARFGGRYRPVLGQGRSAQLQQAPMFTAQIARVQVDRQTGQWRLLAVAAIQDVGRALNPPEVEAQIHGGALQSMGRALGEEMTWDSEGTLLGASFLDYALPSIEQSADRFEVQLLELPSPLGPFGAKGVGEPPAIPGSAAVGNAIRGVLGRRLEKLPFEFATLAMGALDE